MDLDDDWGQELLELSWMADEDMLQKEKDWARREQYAMYQEDRIEQYHLRQKELDQSEKYKKESPRKISPPASKRRRR